ncbi:MAG: methyl-accepting chemotaxis protein [Candidatus Krumholzibacteriota bacterium]|nr:methyl-accepting chemotaxis protein [Candidatus Krumholzibacteriota bacterium]
MSNFRLGKTLSSKVYIIMSLVAFVICALTSFALVTLSGSRSARVLEERNEKLGLCIASLSTTFTGRESELEWENKLNQLKMDFPFVQNVEVLSAVEKPQVPAPKAASGNKEESTLTDVPAPEGSVPRGAAYIIPLSGNGEDMLRLSLLPLERKLLTAGLRWEIPLIVSLALIVIFGFFYYLIHTIIKKPIRQLLRASRLLASNANDLSARIEINSDDELGRLGVTLNDMFSNISEIINVIRTTSDKVNFSAQSLSASTEEMNSITEETSLTVQNIARATDMQAHKVDEMIREIKNMERSVKQVANSADLAASAATNASSTATKGGDSAKEAVAKINTIYDVTKESAEIIRHLGERSNQIGEIVDVITDIADQTNMLALNAAIEAARAGEAGRGFAVVADEVKKLAEGSAKAAEEIAVLIQKTQEDTRTAVTSIDLGSKEVTEGKDVITRTGEALDEIVEVLKSSSDMARRISAATKELSRGMNNVIESIDEISSSAEKNASSTQETAASMEQMTSSMEDVASSAQKLSDMAIQLRENVGRFKINIIDKVDEAVTT